MKTGPTQFPAASNVGEKRWLVPPNNHVVNVSRIFKQSSIYFIGDAARRLVGLFMISVYTQHLTPAEYGLVELIELFVMVATVLFGILAISDAMVRIYYEYENAGKSGGTVVFTAICCLAIVSASIAGVAIWLATPLSELLFRTAQYSGLVRLAFTAMFLANLTEIILVYERLRERAAFFISVSLVYVFLTVILNIYFIAVAEMGVWGFVLSKVIVATASSLFLLARTLRSVELRFCRTAARSMLRFGSPLMIASASMFIIHFADRFFLSHYRTLRDVGIYALAYKFGFLVTYVVGEPFGRVWGVTLYGYTSRLDWRPEFARVAAYLVVALFLVATALSLFADQTIRLFSAPAFYAGAQVVPIIAFAYAMRELGDFFRGVLFINKRSIAFSVVALASAVANLGLNFWLIPRFGYMGAAWATLITWTGYMVSCWFIAHSEHSIPYRIDSFFRITALAVGIACLARLTAFLPLLAQSAADGALVLVFVALVWRCGYFTESEKMRIRRYWRSLDLSWSTVTSRFQ